MESCARDGCCGHRRNCYGCLCVLSSGGTAARDGAKKDKWWNLGSIRPRSLLPSACLVRARGRFQTTGLGIWYRTATLFRVLPITLRRTLLVWKGRFASNDLSLGSPLASSTTLQILATRSLLPTIGRDCAESECYDACGRRSSPF